MIFIDEFSPHNAKLFAVSKTVTDFFAMFGAMGDFHQSVEIAIFTDNCLPNNLPSQRPSLISFCSVQSNGLWTCQVGSGNSTEKDRCEIATDSPPNRQRRAKSGGMGVNRLFWGWGAGEGQPSREEPPNSVFAPALPNALTASNATSGP